MAETSGPGLGGAVPTPDAGTGPSATAPTVRELDPRARRILVAIATVAVAVALVVSMVVLLAGPSYEHYSDTALIELRTFDVGSHTPLLGPFSRFTWTHPGPMLFALL